MLDPNLILNLNDVEQRYVILHNEKYPVLIQGNGRIPCFCIGIGSLLQKTLSAGFKKLFTVYSADLYWIKTHRLQNVAQLTMQQIISDIYEIIRQLNLTNPILFGHSNFGIVATEAAKNPEVNISGVIMMASAPAWNETVIQTARDYFDKNASEERKANDLQRKERFQIIKKPDESEISLNYYEADSARYWEDFNISRQFLEKLWFDIEVDDEIINHFFNKILPQHDLAIQINKITVPVILLAGQYDFDSIPLILWHQLPHPQKFTIVDCGKVGHWPNIENQLFFDNAIKSWISSFIN